MPSSIEITFPNLPSQDRNYTYKQTVFVSGKPKAYLNDLERYFKESWRDLCSFLGHMDRSAVRLHQAIELARSPNRLSDEFHRPYLYENFGCPFQVTKDNADNAALWLEESMERTRNLIASQKINRTAILDALQREPGKDKLDITNYARNETIVRIEHPNLRRMEEGPLRMRIFYDESSEGPFDQDLAESFANRARNLRANPTIRSEVSVEPGVHEIPQDLNDYVKTGKIGRSSLRVSPPTFEVIPNGKGYSYVISLSEPDREMLSEFIFENPRGKLDSTSSCTENLCFGSQTWSPQQGTKMIRNLMGIIGLTERIGVRGRVWYSSFYIPEVNFKALKTALKKGEFVKKVEKESLPVLKFVFDRTRELKERYGWNFYPRFSQQEVSHQTNMGERNARANLTNLTGVLAEVTIPKGGCNVYRNKWFIPKNGIPLAWKILSSAGMVD